MNHGHLGVLGSGVWEPDRKTGRDPLGEHTNDSGEAIVVFCFVEEKTIFPCSTVWTASWIH